MTRSFTTRINCYNRRIIALSDLWSWWCKDRCTSARHWWRFIKVLLCRWWCDGNVTLSANFLIPSLLQFFFRIVLSEEFYQSLLVSVFWSLLKFIQRWGLSGFGTCNVEIYTYQSSTSIDSLSPWYVLARWING